MVNNWTVKEKRKINDLSTPHGSQVLRQLNDTRLGFWVAIHQVRAALKSFSRTLTWPIALVVTFNKKASHLDWPFEVLRLLTNSNPSVLTLIQLHHHYRCWHSRRQLIAARLLPLLLLELRMQPLLLHVYVHAHGGMRNQYQLELSDPQ